MLSASLAPAPPLASIPAKHGARCQAGSRGGGGGAARGVREGRHTDAASSTRPRKRGQGTSAFVHEDDVVVDESEGVEAEASEGREAREGRRRTRRAFLASASFAATLVNSAGPPHWLPSSASAAGLPPSVFASLPAQFADALAPTSRAGRALFTESIRLPMQLEGGTYVVQYTIGATPVRGVVDTGSPFITMEAGAYTRSG